MNPRTRYTVAILIALGAVFGFFAIGIVLVNFVVMPWIVHQGRDVEVPGVVGLSTEDARNKLEAAELKTEVLAERADSSQPAGNIVEQRPGAGTVVKIGRTVGLVVSSGLQRVRVPYLFGLFLPQAQSIIQNLGLKVAAVESLACDSVPAGRIFSIEPPPFTLVDRSTPLRIVISLGAEGTLEMPNLVGLRQADAARLLGEKGLVLGGVREVASEGEFGTVLVQSPEFGALVRPGDTVKLIVIGKGP